MYSFNGEVRQIKKTNTDDLLFSFGGEELADPHLMVDRRKANGSHKNAADGRARNHLEMVTRSRCEPKQSIHT